MAIRCPVTGRRRSLWRAKAPAGTSVEWEAEIVEDRPAERLSWQTIEGSDIQHSGTVTFEHEAQMAAWKGECEREFAAKCKLFRTINGWRDAAKRAPRGGEFAVATTAGI